MSFTVVISLHLQRLDGMKNARFEVLQAVLMSQVFQNMTPFWMVNSYQRCRTACYLCLQCGHRQHSITSQKTGIFWKWRNCCFSSRCLSLVSRLVSNWRVHTALCRMFGVHEVNACVKSRKLKVNVWNWSVYICILVDQEFHDVCFDILLSAQHTVLHRVWCV